MTGPTREEVLEQALQRALQWLASYPGEGTMRPGGPYEQARAALAFAAGSRSGEDARDAARWRTVEALAESRWDGTLGRPAMWWLRVSGVSGHSFGEVIDKVQIDAAMGGNDA